MYYGDTGPDMKSVLFLLWHTVEKSYSVDVNNI
jgi:hypothetical protein